MTFETWSCVESFAANVAVYITWSGATTELGKSVSCCFWSSCHSNILDADCPINERNSNPSDARLQRFGGVCDGFLELLTGAVGRIDRKFVFPPILSGVLTRC